MEGRSEEALASSKDPSHEIIHFLAFIKKAQIEFQIEFQIVQRFNVIIAESIVILQKKCHGTKRKQSANSAISQSASQAFIVQTCVTRSEEKYKHQWFIDSGASQHICCIGEYFQGYKEFASPEKVHLANDTMISGVDIGSVIWEDKELNETTTIENV